MENQGFTQINKGVRIINKLNNNAITISRGQYNSKPDSLIVESKNSPMFQTFKITPMNQSKIYFIEPSNGDLVFSTSKWGDPMYTEVRLDKYDQTSYQFWRIVPYDEVMYNQKDQTKHVFEYKSSIPSSDSLKTVNAPTNDLGLGYNKSTSKQMATQSTPTQPSTGYYKLGYEFQSGPNVNSYVQLKPSQSDKLNYQQQLTAFKEDISNPPRFPVKEKNNLLSKDKDTKGWFFIENVKYNLVLEIYGGIDEPGMSIVLNQMHGNRNQLWKFQ